MTLIARGAVVRLLASLALLVPAVTVAGDSCGSEPVCITAVKTTSGTELRALNQEAFPVTLRIDLMPINMTVESLAASPMVLEPGRAVSLARMQVEDPQRPSDYRYRSSWSRGDYRVQHDDSYVYALPYLPGDGFTVTQSYDGHFSHHGDSRYAVDFAMPEGTPIVAAREGVVVSVRGDSTVGGPNRAYEDKANYVVVQHADGTFAEYLHLQPSGVRVEKGEQVTRGQLIGMSGNTGFSGGPHLHFMVAGATADGGRRSFAVRFQTAHGVVAQLQTGLAYRHGEDSRQPAAAVDLDGVAATVADGRERPLAGRGSEAPAVGAGDAAEPLHRHRD